ncbi:MAG: MlaD family protein [Ahrensia sp.]|nr:MlaD family protein [Ahrensia sp.]
METKANYTAVGLFTVLVFTAAFAFVYWIARSGGGGDTAELDVVIEGSVTGLGIGSPVYFNGVSVGKVADLRFDPTNPKIVIARSRVRNDLPITSSTKALLGFTGLTGIAHIEFEGGDISKPSVFQLAATEGGIATITADPSAYANLLVTAEDIFERAESVLTELEGFVAEARAPLTETLKNTSQITEAIAKNTQKVEAFMVGMGDLGDTLEGVSDGLKEVLAGAGNLIEAVNPQDVKNIVADVRGFTNNLKTVSEDLEGIGKTVNQLASSLGQTGPRIEKAFDRFDEVLAAVDANEVNKAVKGFGDAGGAAAQAAKDVQALTGTLSAQKADVEAIIANAKQMVERLNASSVRVDGVLAKVDGFLGDSNADSLMADVSSTLASFRQVANTLNSRLDGITAGLERFSGRGLQDVEALVGETRRSINRIESAISSLEKNPQRLLFGGEGDVKRFDGRQRR